MNSCKKLVRHRDLLLCCDSNRESMVHETCPLVDISTSSVYICVNVPPYTHLSFFPLLSHNGQYGRLSFTRSSISRRPCPPAHSCIMTGQFFVIFYFRRDMLPAFLFPPLRTLNDFLFSKFLLLLSSRKILLNNWLLYYLYFFGN